MKEYKYKINGNLYNVNVNSINDATAEVEVNGKLFSVEIEKKKESKPVVLPRPVVTPPKAAQATDSPQKSTQQTSSNGTAIKTPLPGVILDIKVNVGDVVKRGQTVAILEAMKMENNINSPKDGKVVAINVHKGDSVAESTDLIFIE